MTKAGVAVYLALLAVLVDVLPAEKLLHGDLAPHIIPLSGLHQLHISAGSRFED